MASATEQWLRDHLDYPHDYCLIWPFARESRVGRAVYGKGGKSKWAHRVMCEMVHGPAPTPKHQAAHSCGNGDQGCVNPRHLKWLTNSENQLERYRIHGRYGRQAGRNHGFTNGDVAAMREAYKQGATQIQLASLYGCSLGTIQYYLKYRDQRRHAGAKLDHWQPDEDYRLREAIGRGYTWNKVSEYVGRPEGAVASRARRLGLRSLNQPQKIAP